MAGALTAAEAPLRLPPLREDLHLLLGPASHDGAPTWTLHDPARNLFIRIGWPQFEMLSRWGIGRSDALAEAIAAETTLRLGQDAVVDFLRFVTTAGLVAPMGEAGSRHLAAEVERRRPGLAAWMLQNYLFLRIRLVNPDRFLTVAARLLGFVFTRGFFAMLLVLALLGLHLVGEQWDGYWHEFLHLFSLEGAILVALALGGAKLVHEFGHGVTARHFGCRVPGMGVALLALWPVLWTDTTDAWRLTDRRARLAIDAAGMGAEMMLAVFATLAWSVLPDGPARTAAFMLSSSTWVITVLINCNPLMRFDGYYLLSDLLEFPNLQPRGFALARWWLRECLFDLREPPPEALPPRLRRLVVAYGVATLIYRFFLFLGIAFLVYRFAFKALGVFLMAVEIGWFIARPVWSEARAWRKALGGRRPRPRALLTLAVVIAGVVALFLPLHGRVSAPALLRSDHEAVLYTNAPGRLVALPANGARVAAGETVFRFDSPSLDSREQVLRTRAAALRAQLEGQVFDPDAAAEVDVAWQELGQVLAEQRALEAERAALDVRAPFAGTVFDVPPSLRPGQFLPKREAVAVLADPAVPVVEAYVAETDLERTHQGDAAWFYPATGEAAVALRVSELGVDSIRTLTDRQLASPFGGPIDARRDPNSGRLEPAGTIYRIVLRPEGTAPLVRRMTGEVVVSGTPESTLGALWRRAVSVIVRESSL